jgi:hypothetical protein
MSALDTERLAIISERLLASPVAQALALSIQDAQPGLVKLAMPFDAANVTKGSLIHGGALQRWRMWQRSQARSAPRAMRRPVVQPSTSQFLISDRQMDVNSLQLLR